MFEDIIKQKASDIMCSISKSGENVNLYQLMFNPKLNQWVKTYLTAEVDWWIYEEEAFRMANARFNMKDPKLSAFIAQYNELLKKNAVFSCSILSSVVLDAIKVQLNVLCRPRTALQWFVFRWEQSKPYQEIVKSLNYLSEYAYLIDGFQQYVLDNKLITNQNDLVSCHQFNKIIREVDNQYLANLSPEDFIQLLSPLFEFFNKNSISSDTAKIPVATVILFLDDKEMSIIASRLENLYKTGELQSISKKYLLGFIYKTLYEMDNLYGESEDLLTNITNEIQHAINAPSDDFSLAKFHLSSEHLSNAEGETTATFPAENNKLNTEKIEAATEELAITEYDENSAILDTNTMINQDVENMFNDNDKIKTIKKYTNSSNPNTVSERLRENSNFDYKQDIEIIEEAIKEENEELKNIISKLKE